MALPLHWYSHVHSPDARRSRAVLAFSVLAATIVFGSTLHAQVVPIEQEPGAKLRSLLGANPNLDVIREGGKIARIYGGVVSTGRNAAESADAFLRDNADILDSDFGQLLAEGPRADGEHVVPLGFDEATDSYRFSLVGYRQHVNGVPVFRSDVRCLVRNEPGYPLVLVSNSLKDVRTYAATFQGRAISPSKLDLRRASKEPLSRFGDGAEMSEQEQVIWAGYGDIAVDAPRLAYKFIVQGPHIGGTGIEQRILFVVDADSNKILFEEDQILHANVSCSVQGNCTTGTAAAECNAEVPTGLPYAAVTAGGATYYADANGSVTVPNASSAAVSINSSMALGGRYFQVIDASPLPESSITQSSAGGSLVFLHNAANTDESNRAEVNAYLHANKARDFVLQHHPGFPIIATQTVFPIEVQFAGTCNAFYLGNRMRFYASGGGCRNSAFSTIVYHEYGHHVVFCAGSDQGAYGEGFGDSLAAVMTDESRLGVGFNTCTAASRDANNTVQYSTLGCSSSGSESHDCGMLLSGSVWSVRDRLQVTNPTAYRTILARLLVDSALLHGNTTAISHSIVADWLALDDNDGTIANGTPHYNEIYGGFAAHGLYGYATRATLWSRSVPETSNPPSTTPWANEGYASGQPVCVDCNSSLCQYATNSTNSNTTPLTCVDFDNYTLPAGHRIVKVEVEVAGRYNTATTASIGFRAWAPGYPIDSGWRNTASFSSGTLCEPRCGYAGDITALSTSWDAAKVNALQFQIRRQAGLTNNILRVVSMRVIVTSAPIQ